MKGKNTFAKYPYALYSIVPNEAWTVGLSPRARLTYLYCVCQSEAYNPTAEMIGKAIGFSRLTVNKALQELCDGGLLRVIKHRQYDPTTNRYSARHFEIVPPKAAFKYLATRIVPVVDPFDTWPDD